jgi:hypothetical protein
MARSFRVHALTAVLVTTAAWLFDARRWPSLYAIL